MNDDQPRSRGLTAAAARRLALLEKMNRDLKLDDEDIVAFAPVPRTRRARSSAAPRNDSHFAGTQNDDQHPTRTVQQPNPNSQQLFAPRARPPPVAFGRGRTTNRHIDGAPKISRKSGLLYGGTAHSAVSTTCAGGARGGGPYQHAGGGFSGGASSGGIGEPNTLLLGATPSGRIWPGPHPGNTTRKLLTVQNANRTRPVAFSCCAFNGDGGIVATGDRRGCVSLFYLKQNRFATLEKGAVGANSRAAIGCLGFTNRRIEEVWGFFRRKTFSVQTSCPRRSFGTRSYIEISGWTKMH